jgi:hypothetical protein
MNTQSAMVLDPSECDVTCLHWFPAGYNVKVTPQEHPSPVSFVVKLLNELPSSFDAYRYAHELLLLISITGTSSLRNPFLNWA